MPFLKIKGAFYYMPKIGDFVCEAGSCRSKIDVTLVDAYVLDACGAKIPIKIHVCKKCLEQP